MATKKKTNRSSPRRTAIVPRVVFQTMVAAAVVPVMGGLAGCDRNMGPATSDAAFSVVAAPDSGFSVVAIQRDAGRDAGFSVVAIPRDTGPDEGFFSVVAMPEDGGEFSVLVAPHDSGSSAS